MARIFVMTRGFTSGCFAEIVVQPVREGFISFCSHAGLAAYCFFNAVGIDEQLHPQILIDLRFAFGLGEAAHGVDVVCFDAIEIVFGLRIYMPKTASASVLP